ncbi:MAG TPA: ATP-binding cassette domain-containing protein [Thermoleophilia bacterium]|nr:ATP-binding cassette domain-containing protein [Thermoleophilia bacterium]
MTGPPWGVQDLTVRFGRRTALEGVSLDVPAGAVTAVLGGDGAGKTTLLRALAGGIRPTHGRVRRPERSRLGYVAGASGLYADLSVDENIAFVARAYGLGGTHFETRAQELFERIGLQGTGPRLAMHLSGGMRQKLALALALLHEPDLLILDEPTTGVDLVSRADLWRLIAGAAAGGAGVVVSTSYGDEALRAAAALFLDAGRATHPEDGMAAHDNAEGRTLVSTTPIAPDKLAYRAATAQASGASASAPLAMTQAVTRLFGRFTAIDNVDLAIAPGEVVGLLGANGAGKTTLIRLLLGLVRPTTGHVELFGRAPSRETRGRIGYVPQGLGLWEDLTAAENLAFVAQAFGRTPPPLAPDLDAVSSTLVRDLPLGLRRRLAFAAALAHEPDLLVLDEPTSGVDADARARLWDTVHASALAGSGVLVTTHHMEEAGECDRLVVMAAGRVIADGALAAIIGGRVAVVVETDRWPAAFAALEDAGLTVALVGRTLRVPDRDIAGVQAALATRGVSADVRVVPATFEETFVALVQASDTPPAHTRDDSPAERTAQ